MKVIEAKILHYLIILHNSKSFQKKEQYPNKKNSLLCSDLIQTFSIFITV